MLILRLLIVVSLLQFLSPATQAQQLTVYRGLLHGHTSFSDGLGTPDEAFQMAKDAGLDFMACTEHNHDKAAGSDGVFLTPRLHEELVQMAQDHTVDGEFVAIWGQEVSTISAGNHVNIFFTPEICDIGAGDFKTLYEEWLPEHPEVPFIQFNHPDFRGDQRRTTAAKKRNNDYGIDDYDKDFEKLLAASGRHVALIELIIGPAFSTSSAKLHQQGKHEADYLFYLNQGYRLAPSVGQDNHHLTWGKSTEARMGVWATSLTVDGLKEAILNRRTYASEDEDVIVKFDVNGSVLGSVITLGDDEPAQITVSVVDDDEPDARYRVRIFYDDGIGGSVATVVEDVRLAEGRTEITFVHTPEPGGYYFAKITQDSDHEDDIWTAPVWISDGTQLFAGTGAPVNTDDPELQEIEWDQAHDYVSRPITVSGTIIRSVTFQDRVLFFNFDPDYENTLNLIVFEDDFDTFDGVEALQERLLNKRVTIRGTITLYRGERMQIKLESLDQIVAVEDE